MTQAEQRLKGSRVKWGEVASEVASRADAACLKAGAVTKTKRVLDPYAWCLGLSD